MNDPWLDRLPGVVAGAFFRRRIEKHFQEGLQGEVLTYAEEHGLRVHVLRPQTDHGAEAPARGCIVFLHGGGFLGGAPSQFYPYARMVTQRFGLVAACCEFRSFLTHPFSKVPFDAVSDAQRCVMFLQDDAENLRLDRQRFVFAGASSGGHLAAMAALGGDNVGAVSSSCPGKPELQPRLSLAGLVLFNPVLDLCSAEGWRQRRPTVWLGSWVLRARYGTGALEAGSPLRQINRLPYPTLILHGTEDQLVPIREVETFRDRMLQSGNNCSLVPFQGEGHFFFNWRVSPTNFARCIDLLGEFLVSAGFGSNSLTGCRAASNSSQ